MASSFFILNFYLPKVYLRAVAEAMAQAPDGMACLH
jgi:hypothetical protein